MEENTVTADEVFLAVKKLTDGDEMLPEMLKALNRGIIWLTRVCQVAWGSGSALKDWQTGMTIHIHKKRDGSECINYRGISLRSLLGKANANALKEDAAK